MRPFIIKKKIPGILMALLLSCGMFWFMAVPSLAANVTVSVTVTSQTVNPGSSFDVTLKIDNTVAVFGWQSDVTFDNTKLTYNSVTEGTFLKNNGSTISGGSPDTTVDGAVSGIAYSLTGTHNAPAGTGGILATLNFTAKSGASGTTTIGLRHILMTDPSASPISGITSNNYTITISGSASQAPTISSFNPSSGGTGTSVVITGTNFTGATAVSFGGTAAQSYNINSATQITAIVGTGSTGTIGVTTPNGSINSSSSFTFSTTAPTITSFSPSSGATGTSVTITGTNFTGVSAVSFGGTAAQNFTVNSATQITAIVGGGSSGSVSVTTSGGTATASGFSYTSTAVGTPAAPTISSFNPTSAGKGTLVTITGTNFNGASAVSFGGVAANDFTVYSATQITATVNTGASGSISVTTPGGTATLAGFTFSSGTSPSATTSSNNPVHPNTTSGSTLPITIPASTPSANTAPKSSSSPKAAASPRAVSLTRNTTIDTIDLSNAVDAGGLMSEGFQLAQDIRYDGNNRITNLEIKSGTRALDKDGNPLQSINVLPLTQAVTPPSGENIITAIDFEPSGATFSTPISVTIDYDPKLLQGFDASNLALEYFDPQENMWIGCDYTPDSQDHQISANISHFSLFAIVVKNSCGMAAFGSVSGVGWNMAAIIVVAELALGGLIIFLFLRRRQSTVPAMATVQSITAAPIAGGPQVAGPPARIYKTPENESNTVRGETRATCYEFLEKNIKKGEPFKTHLEVSGGKIVIPRDSKSADIEIVNSPDSRIMISLEYDPETRPKGLAKILILGSASEYEKSKENRK